MWFYITHKTTHVFKVSRQNSRSCQEIQDQRSYQEFQESRSCHDIQDEIQDLPKKFKMSRQILKSFQDIQEFNIFLIFGQDIQDVEGWAVNWVCGYVDITN